MADIDFRQKHLQFRRMIGAAYMPKFNVSHEWENIKIPILNKVCKVLIPKYNLDEFTKKVEYEKVVGGFIKFKTFADYKPGGVYNVELYRCKLKNKEFYMIIYDELAKLASAVISTSTNNVLANKIVDGYLVTKMASYKFLDLNNKYALQIIDMLKESPKEYDTNIMIFLDGLSGAKEQFTVYDKDIVNTLISTIKSSKNYNTSSDLFKLMKIKMRKGNNTIVKGLDFNYYLNIFEENYKYEGMFTITVNKNDLEENDFKAIHRKIEYKIDSTKLNLKELFENVPIEIDEEFKKETFTQLGFTIIIDEKLQKMGIGLVNWHGEAVGIPLKILLPIEYIIYLKIPKDDYTMTSTKYLIGKTKRDLKKVLNDFIKIVKQELDNKENILI